MMTSHYMRLTGTTVGPGAGSVLRTLWEQLQKDEKNTVIGTVDAVFDRTLYVSAPVTVGRYDSSVFALGVSDLAGEPLVVGLETPPGFSFRDHCSPLDTVRFRREEDELLKIAVGSTFVAAVDVGETTRHKSTEQALQYPCSRFSFGTEPVRTHTRILSWVANEGVTDDLGQFELLRRVRAGYADPPVAEISPTLHNFVETACLEVLGRDPPRERQSGPATVAGTVVQPNAWDTGRAGTTPISLLGRGSGATPAGDDFLSGLLLVLQGIADPELQPGIQAFADRIVSHAHDRTTTVSAALLEQAALGHAAQPVFDCLVALTRPEQTFEKIEQSATDLLEVGHSSGADTLAGMLTATTVVLPSLERCTHSATRSKPTEN